MRLVSSAQSVVKEAYSTTVALIVSRAMNEGNVCTSYLNLSCVVPSNSSFATGRLLY